MSDSVPDLSEGPNWKRSKVTFASLRRSPFDRATRRGNCSRRVISSYMLSKLLLNSSVNLRSAWGVAILFDEGRLSSPSPSCLRLSRLVF